MEERDGEVRWDGLCSRDAAARAAALDTIGQAVLRRAESIAPAAAADGLPAPAARDGLGEALARLLMLSKRCPFPDVREKSEAILGGVQCSTFLTIHKMTTLVDIVWNLSEEFNTRRLQDGPAKAKAEPSSDGGSTSGISFGEKCSHLEVAIKGKEEQFFKISVRFV
ncbi:hypothetical protein BTVI_92155 [Pitangus sulphuratus]|nr:hypothetical protein BTVI_92155 [Pitangus sulphuratus]